MKFWRRFTVCALPASLTLLTVSCHQTGPSLRLLQTAEIDFPSASGIEFYQNKLYLFGDDAPHLLILSLDYKTSDTVRHWPQRVGRIPKNEKLDIESAAVITKGGKEVLAGIGSLSGGNRWTVVEYDVASRAVVVTRYFDSTSRFLGITQLNVEGAASVDGGLLLANRGNLSNSTNHLVFWKKGRVQFVKELRLPRGKTFAGVSGLYYMAEKDLLLFTASEETTANAVDDGAIGGSYLGGIRDFSAKGGEAAYIPSFYLPLTDVDAAFVRQKIESVCVERLEGEKMVLHLAADNDDGRSRLFKVKLSVF